MEDCYTHIFPSVGPTGVVWAVDSKDTVWRRAGARYSVDMR